MAGRKKVTIVGGGQTGGIMAYHLAQKNICDIVIKDVAEFAQHHGKSLDIMQGGPFGGFETKITPTDDWEATKDSDVIVITSGAPRKPGMTREDLLKTNADVVGDYAAKNAAQLSPNAIMIIFANPMDVMCHAAARATGLPRNQIIGQGGMLDSSRFRTFIAMECGCSPRDVSAYVLGGHTDATMVPIVSQARVGGMPLTSLLSADKIDAIVKRTMNRASVRWRWLRRSCWTRSASCPAP
jgi:malate dehydrogenase